MLDFLRWISETVTNTKEKAQEIADVVESTTEDLKGFRKRFHIDLPELMLSVKTGLWDLKDSILWLFKKDKEQDVANIQNTNSNQPEITETTPLSWEQLSPLLTQWDLPTINYNFFATINTITDSILQQKYPNQARVKNNNPTWITRWVSSALKDARTQAWIKYEQWTERPTKEQWNYVRFQNLGDWIRATQIAFFRQKGKTVRKRLEEWVATWEDGYVWDVLQYAELLNSNIENIPIQDLAQQQKEALIYGLICKESNWIYKEYLKDAALSSQPIA